MNINTQNEYTSDATGNKEFSSSFDMQFKFSSTMRFSDVDPHALLMYYFCVSYTVTYCKVVLNMGFLDNYEL